MGKRIFWENLQFTRSAAQWTIILSVLGIVKSLVWTGLGMGHWMIYFIPILRIIPYLYLALFIFFRIQNSPYASVCFARGLCHFIPIVFWLIFGSLFQTSNPLPFYIGASLHPLLSLALIIFVLSTERIGGESLAEGELRSDGQDSINPWKDFFFMPKISFGLILLISLAAFVFSSGASQREIQQNIGIAVFVSCVLGILVNGIGILVFFLKHRPHKAFGCMLSSCGLAIAGFFGCVSALSGVNFH